MTPEEEAKELVEKFLPLTKAFAPHTGWIDDLPEAKKAAIICVDEIWDGMDKNFEADPDRPALSERRWNLIREYWQSVKQEIEKL